MRVRGLRRDRLLSKWRGETGENPPIWVAVKNGCDGWTVVIIQAEGLFKDWKRIQEDPCG